LFSIGFICRPNPRHFIQDVLESNPAIQAAKTNILAAKARQSALGKPLYNPELIAEKENAIDNTELLGINQTIDWTNKRGAREQVGAANVLLAQAEFDSFQQRLISDTLSALANYQFQSNAVVLAKKRVALLEKFVTLTRRRYESGDIARVNLDLAQLAYSESVAQQANEESKANHALQKLRAVTGLRQARWPRLPEKLPRLSIKKIDIEKTLRNLPVVGIFNQQYQAAHARIKLAERNRYPDPTIGVQGGRNYGQSESRKLFGLTLSIPLFVRNSYGAEVDAANYDATEADSKRENIIREMRAELISSAERYQYLYNATSKWQHATGKPLGDGIVLIERLWKAGEMNSTDYLVQIKQRVDSEIAGVELRGRAWDAWIDWLRVSGKVKRWSLLKV
tara:strand:+ start:459 stop:1643 length:1185 start_codon:yes stop_codon:yes gene_type:complete